MSTPIHAVRIDDETWGRWTEEARKRKLNMSDFIRGAVEAALEQPGDTKIARALAVFRGAAPNDLAGPVTPDPRPTKKGRS